MAFELTNTGLQTETLGEIQDDLKAKVWGKLGNDFDLTADSVDGQILAIMSERIAALQGEVVSVLSGVDRDQASGAQLDGLASVLDVERRKAVRSSISVTLGGDPFTDVSSKLVQYLPTGSLWRTPASTIIGADGRVETQLLARDTGAVQARAAPSSQWVIVDSVSGWNTVESTIDAVVGQPAARDPELRAAMKLAADGAARATTSANERNVASVADTLTVRLFENPSLSPAPDPVTGLTGKQARFLVEGGIDEEIARAIFDTVAGDVELVGAVNPVFDHEIEDPTTGDVRVVSVDWIRFDRVTTKLPFLRITIDVTGAPSPLEEDPDIFAAIRAEVDAFSTATLDTGDALVPFAFVGPTLAVLPEGSFTSVLVEAKKEVADPYQTQPLLYAPNERPDVVGSPRPAEIFGGVGPYSLLGGDILGVKVDGGAEQEVELDPIDFDNITAAKPLEVAGVITDNVSGAVGGVLASRVSMTSETSGTASSLEVTQDPGIAFPVGVVTGTDTRVEIVITGA